MRDHRLLAEADQIPTVETLEARILLAVATGAIEGRVSDYDTDTLLGGISIDVFQGWDPAYAGREAWDHVTTIQTTPDGRYEVLGLAEQYYRLRIWEGQQVLSNNYIDADLFNVGVVSGQTNSGLDFILHEAGYIYGYVYDVQGNPVANADVVTEAEYTEEDSFDWHNTRTDQNGRYELYLAPTDSQIYPIMVNYADGYVSQVAPSLYSAEVDGTRGTDFYLAQGGTLHGRVTTAQGDPVTNINAVEMIAIVDGVTIWSGSWTDQNGEFWITNVPASQEVALVTVPWDANRFDLGGVHYSWGERYVGTYTLSAGQIVDVGTLVIPEAVTVAGTVTDPQGDPIPWVDVGAFGFDIAGGEIWMDDWDGAVTDENGYYEFDWIPAGSFTLAAWADDYLRYRGETTFDMFPGEQVVFDFTMQPSAGGTLVTGSITNFDQVAPKNDSGLVLPYEMVDYEEYGRVEELGVLSFDPSAILTLENLLFMDRIWTGETYVEDGWGDYFGPSQNPAGTYEIDVPLGPQAVFAYRTGPTEVGGWYANLSNPVFFGQAEQFSFDGTDLFIPIGDNSVTGSVLFPPGHPGNLSESSVTIYLLSADYSFDNLGIAIGNPGYTNEYILPDLPAGLYIILAVAQDAGPFVSAPFTLSQGQTLQQDIVFDYGNLGAEIHGTVWNDLNGDGWWDEEPGLEGWTVFLDDNGNGVLDPFETSTVTGPGGYYDFLGLDPGSYLVTEQILPNWEQTYPGGGLFLNSFDGPISGFTNDFILSGYGIHVVDLLPGDVVQNIDFGNWMPSLFAPDLTFAEPQETYYKTEINSTVFIPIELLNIGDDLAIDATVDLYLSTDDTVDMNDTLVGSFTIASLSPQQVHQQTLSFQAPGTAGTYYLAAVADPGDSVFETDETNNFSTVLTLELVDFVGDQYFAFAEYFPLDGGLTRYYQTTQTDPGSNKLHEQVVRSFVALNTTEINGIETYELQKFYNQRHLTNTFYTMDDNGLYLHGQSHLSGGNWNLTSFDSPFLMCPADIYVGMTVSETGTWRGTSKNQPWTGTYRQDLQVLGFEQVVTAAGTFNALKLKFDITASKGPDGARVAINDQYTVWLVSGLGMVSEEGIWTEMHDGQQNPLVWTFEYQMLPPPNLTGHFDWSFAAPSLAVPGTKMRVPYIVENEGLGDARGNIAVEIYGSADGQDSMIFGRADNVRINLAPGQSKKIYVNIVAPLDMQPGEYSLSGMVDADNVITESDEADNLAVSGFSTEWTYRFGNVGGGKNVILTVLDGFGTPVTFKLRGNGYGEVTRDDDGHINVIFHGTDNRSSATFTTPRWRDGVIRDIIVLQEQPAEGAPTGGSLRSLTAKTTDLIGDVKADGWLGKLQLDDIADEHIIEIAGAGPAVTMIFDSVGDTSILSTPPIASLKATEWLDSEDSPADQIVTSWLGKLQIKGRRGNSRRNIPAVLGHFGADLILSGVGATKATLTSAKIAGDLYGALWDIAGYMGKLTVAGIVELSKVRTTGSMGAISLGAAVGSDFLAGITRDVSRHASSIEDFVNLNARIRSLKIKGLKLPGVDEDPYFFENSNFSAAGIGKVSLLNLWPENNEESFGFFAFTRTIGTSPGGGGIASISHRDTVTRNRWSWNPADGDLNILDFTAQVLTG